MWAAITAPAPSQAAVRRARKGASGRRDGRSIVVWETLDRRLWLRLEGSSGGRGSRGVDSFVADLDAREVVVGQEKVRVGSTPHDGEQVGHARDFLTLLLEEPVEELRADQVVLLPGE